MSLGEVCDIKNGYAFKSKDFCSSGIPVVKIKNVKPNQIIESDFSYVPETVASEKSKWLISKGEILLTMTGNRADGSPESWVGKAALFALEGKYLLNQRVASIKSNSDALDTEYLGYYLSSWESQLYFIKHSNSSGGQANISPTTVKEYSIFLPPIDEQKRIVSILRALDNKIKINNRINANLQQQAQAIFKSWFVDFEPFQDGEFVESELGPIPKGWRVGTVGENYILNPEIYSPKESWKLVNYLDTSSITKGVIGEIQEIDTTTQKLPSRARRKVKTGDIVYSTVRPNQKHYGMLFNVPEKFLVSTGFVTIRETCKSCSNYYLYMILTAQNTEDMLQQIAETSTSTFPAIRSDDISNLSILIPEENVGGQFRDVVEPLFQCVAHNMRENQRLAQLRDTLLPKLMNGEIDISGI